MIQLKGGLGNQIVQAYKPVRQTKQDKCLVKQLASIRDAREAQFDREAHEEADAIRQHRLLTPARLLTQGRAS